MKMKQIALLPVVAILVCCLTNVTNADVPLYDNGAGGASGIETAWGSDYDSSEFGLVQEIASSFSLTSTANVTSINWTGGYHFDNNPNSLDDFSILFYDDDFDIPESTPFWSVNVGNDVARMDTGIDLTNSSGGKKITWRVYEYTASISSPTFDANTTYWLSIVNSSIGEPDVWAWGATFEDNVLGQVFRQDGGVWTPFIDFDVEGRQDFRLNGNVVPEPSSTALLGVYLIGAWMRRRR